MSQRKKQERPQTSGRIFGCLLEDASDYSDTAIYLYYDECSLHGDFFVVLQKRGKNNIGHLQSWSRSMACHIHIRPFEALSSLVYRYVRFVMALLPVANFLIDFSLWILVLCAAL
ncbi:uncharacterized protein BDV17DRAFT_15831 [Aspergillus undulatus]|uniref:uncharacterized protein n=1 Tax=Aspergillus undulatus TaxID=1810928 RepID=UPI003CCCBDED